MQLVCWIGATIEMCYVRFARIAYHVFEACCSWMDVWPMLCSRYARLASLQRLWMLLDFFTCLGGTHAIAKGGARGKCIAQPRPGVNYV